MKLAQVFKNYFMTRKTMDDSFFRGKMTSDPSLCQLQKAIDDFYLPLKNIAKTKAPDWKVQIGFGKGNATADQYVALIPPGQKVSEGIFFCICFDHSGTGCVLGVMTAIKKTPKIKVTLVRRANFCPDTEPSFAWKLIPPNTIDIKKWNNAFVFFQEINFDEIQDSEDISEEKIITCIEKSIFVINDILP